GCIDETGTAKSGRETAGVKRQYNGNRGKIENCINNVALPYSAQLLRLADLVWRTDGTGRGGSKKGAAAFAPSRQLVPDPS
ncbi:MAG: transposase, partial [Fuerstiella sp.]